jgi:hypothetical protein
MSTEELLQELLNKVAGALIPVQIDAWDTEHIARYMKRTVDTVRREIVVQPDFPKPMRIPGAGKGRALWKAREVVAWLESRS